MHMAGSYDCSSVNETVLNSMGKYYINPKAVIYSEQTKAYTQKCVHISWDILWSVLVWLPLIYEG